MSIRFEGSDALPDGERLEKGCRPVKEFRKLVNFKPGIAVRTYWDSLGVKEEEVLFVDIETTGLSSKRDAIYQIGLAYQEKSGAAAVKNTEADETAAAAKNTEADETAAAVKNTAAEDEGASWTILQWLCERRGEEKELLRLFFECLAGYRLLMHFNGTTFDLPFIRQRALKYKNRFPGFGMRRVGKADEDSAEDHLKTRASGEESLTEEYKTEIYTPLDGLISTDMFRIFSPLASFLGLPNKKQKSFEAFLGIDREDALGGGDLIPVYCEYEMTGDERLEHYLMIHNHEDMKGMLRLTELFAYRSLREGSFRVESFALQEDRDFAGEAIHELTVKLRLEAPVPKRFVLRSDGFYFEAAGTENEREAACAGKKDMPGTAATAVIRLEEGVMKHFFTNYRDYDYLIKEDTAVYRTVGNLVDPSLRRRATAETCYMKREGLFLRVDADCAAPLFRRTYKSKDVYVLAGEDMNPGIVKNAVRTWLR